MAGRDLKAKKEWTNVRISRATKRKLDQIGGKAPSYDATIEGISDVVTRERLIEKVRRKILGVADLLESGITPGKTQPPEPPQDPPRPE